MSRLRCIATIFLLLLSGCTLGPKYKRPAAQVPDTFRGVVPNVPPSPQSLGEEKWWTVFQDPQLQALIREALSQNYDVAEQRREYSRRKPRWASSARINSPRSWPVPPPVTSASQRPE